MTTTSFEEVVQWLRIERDFYQVKKFDYDEEREKDADYWEQQFDNYITRLVLFPMYSQQFKQAALKLAATAIALCEHCAEDGTLPKAGLPSGELQ